MLEEKYEFTGERLGKGSFGKVEKVIRLRDRQVLAIKVVKEQTKKFGRKSDEARIHKSLCHPNIVKMYEVTVHVKDRSTLMVLDIADTTLKHVIDTRRFRPETFCESMRLALCRGTACGLHYLHEEASVLHRDLKPSNILVVFEKEPRPLIADFGLAKHRCCSPGIVNLDAGEPMTAKVISAGYIPPELLQCRGTVSYDAEVDIWSCGVIAFEVATLERFMPTPDTLRSQLNYIAQRMGTAGGVATGSYVPEQLRGVRALEPLGVALLGTNLATGIFAALKVEPTQRASARELEHLFSGGGDVSQTDEAAPHPLRGETETFGEVSQTEAAPQRLRGETETFSLDDIGSFLVSGGPAPRVKTMQLPGFEHCKCNSNCLTPGHRRNCCQAKEVEVKSKLCVLCRCEWLGCIRPKCTRNYCHQHIRKLEQFKEEIRFVSHARKIQQEMIPCDLSAFFMHYARCRPSLLMLLIVGLVKEPAPVDLFVQGADPTEGPAAMFELLVRITHKMREGGQSPHELAQLHRPPHGVFLRVVK